MVPDTLRVEPLPLSPEQQARVDKAGALIDEARLADIVAGMVSIPSPTGEKGALARHLAEVLDGAGSRGGYQPIDEPQGDGARPRGRRQWCRPSAYAPIDTLTAGNADEDVPWIGPELRPDMRVGDTSRFVGRRARRWEPERPRRVRRCGR